MKPGDIIRSHVDIPLIPVDPCDGDAHPVGALPVGTTVCLMELQPGTGAIRCRTAGASATVIRRGKLVGDPTAMSVADMSADHLNDLTDDHVVMLRNNGNRKLLRLLPNCMVVVGQVSNEEHNKERFSKFGEKKWRGIKQRSGLWQRKTGRFGRKIRPIGPPLNCVTPPLPAGKLILKYTRPGDPEYTREKERRLHALMHPVPNERPPAPVPQKSNGLPTSQPLFRWCSWASVR
ncbi:39S ribosomal protein L2 mitochondrial [Fasciola hepatica]|uniref:39S ribosomal protein L2 mitochondrial n=1 Tax=Fasciola hepatica TaxID=6192 RepID=A0A4E0QW73_FASHE|nr:39S ribosomal protein L2 mitochondrial [Fasciola hepatica]